MIIQTNNANQFINPGKNVNHPLADVLFSPDLIPIIFSNLNLASYEKTFQVCQTWHLIATNSVSTVGKMIIYKEIAIRNETWRQAGLEELLRDENDAEEYSSLPSNIFNELKKSKSDSHLLFHLPKTFNLETMRELFKKYFPDAKNDGYQFLTTSDNDIILTKSQWLLLKTTRISESEGKEFNEQQGIAIELKYTIPCVTQVAAGMLGEYAKSKTQLFLEKEIRCLDASVDGSEQRTIKFSEKGPIIAFDFLADPDIGITGIKVLS